MFLFFERLDWRDTPWRVMLGGCSRCATRAELRCYGAKSYFAFAGLSLFYLGRRTVLDECSTCRHKIVVDSARLRQVRQERLSLAETDFLNTPDPAHARVWIETAATVEAVDELPGIVDQLISRFPFDASIPLTAGRAFAGLEKIDRAAALFDLAARLDQTGVTTDLVIASLIEHGRPHQAERHLRGLIDRRSLSAIGRIDLVVDALQDANENPRALRLMDDAATAFPHLSHDPYFRGRYQAVQQCLTTRQPRYSLRVRAMLAAPRTKKPAWAVRWALPILLILLVLGAGGGFGGSYYYHTHNRRVVLVNGTRHTYTVIMNGERFTLLGMSEAQTTAPDGDVVVTTEDDPTLATGIRRVPIKVKFWQRALPGPIFVINPDQLAAVYTEQQIYGEDTPTSRARLKPPQIFYGQFSYEIAEPDYLFEEFPKQIRLDNGSYAIKTRLARVSGTASDVRAVIQHFLGKTATADYEKRAKAADPAVQWDPPDEKE